MRPNRAQAKAYLQQALQELGLQRPPTLVLLAGDNPISNIQSEWVQQTLKAELGIEVKIDKQIFKQRLAKMTSGDFDFVLAGWGPDYADPLTFGDLFASWNKNNRGQYNSPELDALIYTAQSRLEPGIRMRLWRHPTTPARQCGYSAHVRTGCYLRGGPATKATQAACHRSRPGSEPSLHRRRWSIAVRIVFNQYARPRSRQAADS